MTARRALVGAHGAGLFGEYRLTRGTVSPLSPFGLRSSDAGGHDLLYGVRVRF